MKKILLLIFLLTSIFAYAEKRTIIVVDKKTQEELIGVTVHINDTTYYTDFDGVLIVDMPEDTTKIKVEYPSYQTKEIKVSESQVIEMDSE
jgi:hypothetical protein